jgi:ATP-dependent helicase/nuclease subunit B
LNIEANATSYGAKALDLLASQIAELKGADPLSPATVVVSSSYMSVATRRALAARPGGMVNVHFTTARGLAEKLVAARLAEAGRRPASAPMVAAAIRAALHDAPGIFAPVADHPATEQALSVAYLELRRVPETAANAVAQCSSRARDILRICQDARERLSVRSYDEEDLFVTATQGLTERAHPEIGPVVVHLLPSLNATHADFVRSLASRGPLIANVGLTGNPDADNRSISAFQRAGITVAIPVNLEPAHASGIISASDPDDEVRSAVRLVMQWAQDGIRLGRIAVLYGNTDPYARLLQAQLGAAGIAVTGVPVRSLADLLFGRALRALLALPDKNFRRPDVLAVLADAPILDGDRPALSRAWERLSREAGVVGGDDWGQRLPLFAADKRKRADKADADGNTSRAENHRRAAERAESLAAFIQRLRTDLSQGDGAGTWAALVDWARDLLRTYLGDEAHREGWPEAEQDAASRVEQILDQLAELDALAGPVPSVGTFRQVLDQELNAPARQVGRLGAGVLVGDLSLAPGLTFDRLVVLGMAEGCFPSPHLEDSLLPDSERASAEGHLQLRAERVHDDHRNLLAAIAGAQESVLTWPRGDLRKSNDQPASRWLLDSAAALSGVPDIRSEDLLRIHHEPWFDNIASFADGLVRTPVFTSAQELRLAAVARGELSSSVVTGDATLAAALDIIDQRTSHDFTRFDGNLTSVTADLPELQRVSATQLQTWATCPRDYLFKYLLSVEHIEEPERQLSINALDRGTLFHAIMEHFIREFIASGHPMDNWSETDRDRLHEIAHQQFERFRREGRTGRELLWRRDQSAILAELDRTIDLDNTRLARGLRPVAAERDFNLIEVPISGDRILHLRGSIDRIDQAQDRSLEIIDYKTGKHDDYKNLTEQNPHDGGKRMQLYIYALAGRDRFPDAPSATAYYWFTKTDRLVGYQVTESVEQEVSAAIRTIVDGIEAGMFPAHPSEKAPRWVECWSCAPDGLSSTQLRSDWERKRDDPALAPYADLCEPEAVE